MNTAPSEHNLAILLVEDSSQDEALIRSTLKREGLLFDLYRLMNAEDFQRALTQRQWDVIITDYHMPIFCANEVLLLLRESGLDIPCIVASGHIGEEAAIALMREGASDFISKSNLSRLAPAIMREVAESRNRREKSIIKQTLAKQERLLADIVSALGEGLVVTDLDGYVLLANPESQRLLGWTERELMGQDFHHLVHHIKCDGTPYSKSDCQIDYFTRQGAAYRSDNEMFVRKDGSGFDVTCTVTPIIDNGLVMAIIIMFTDISDRKRAEQELKESKLQYRELSNFLQSVREEERTHLARELHDELGQLLTALKLDVSWIMHRLTDQQDAILAKADRMLSLIDTTVDSMRRIAANLRPSQLDDLGLAAAIEWLLDGFLNRTGVQFTLSMNRDEFDFSVLLSTAIFRVLQEALTNVARHAQASSIDILINDEGDYVQLRLTDNGIGFDVEAIVGHRKSFGLLGMRERVLSLSGQFEIVSHLGQGTMLNIILPKT